MGDWFNIRHYPPEKRKLESTDVRFDLFVSPYEIPKAVRALTVDDVTLRIEFTYIDGPEKEERAIAVTDGVRAARGKHSHRLMWLEIDAKPILERSGADSVRVSIQCHPEIRRDLKRLVADAFRAMSERFRDADERQTLGIAQTALGTREDDLLSRLTPA